MSVILSSSGESILRAELPQPLRGRGTVLSVGTHSRHSPEASPYTGRCHLNRGHDKVGARSRQAGGGVQWSVLARIALAGLLLLWYISGWARMNELQSECRRLDRLIATETLKQCELARRRAEICDPARLERLAPLLNMVKAPVSGRVIALRGVPAVEPSDTDALGATRRAAPQPSALVLPRLPAVEAGIAGGDFWW